MPILDDDQINAIILKGKGEKSIREYAREIGVSAPYLADVLHGNRNPGPKILKHFKVKRTKKVTIEYTFTRDKK
jgi:transcriptional regulator with XRE-family HTH domain